MRTFGVALRSSTLSVDRENGIIHGVAIITAGVTKPSGNGLAPFYVDGESLRQVANAINSDPHGVRARITHVELEGGDSIDRIVGTWRNARLDGDRVVADLHIGAYAAHSPNGNMREFLLGLAEDASAFVGTSIYSRDAEIVTANVETGRVLRLSSLYSVDWVGEPAANPAGMLSAAPESNAASAAGANMDLSDKQMEYLHSIGLPMDADAAAVEAFVAGLTDEQRVEFNALAMPVSAEGSPDGGEDAGAMVPPQGASSDDESAAKTEEMAASAAAPLGRLRDIARLAGLDDTWVVEMHLAAKTDSEATQIALAASKAKEPIKMKSTDIRVGGDRNIDTLRDAVRDAVLLKANRPTYQFEDNDTIGGRVVLSAGKPVERNPHERANQFRYRRLLDIGREYLIALGVEKARGMSAAALAPILLSTPRWERFVRTHGGDVALSGAHATGDFASILRDAMGKSLRQAYAVAPTTWNLWCRKTTAPDFKTQRRVQLGQAPDLVSMVEGEEYEYGTVVESQETYTLSKYGKGLAFTREMLINDDLGAFDRIPQQMGLAARRLEEATAYGILTANAVLSDSVALFATAHANLATGTLSVASLSTAKGLMRKQAPLGGTTANPLDLTPSFLIVPAELETVAQQLVASTVDPAKANATINPPWIRGMTVISSAILSGTSSVQWYLAADSGQIDTVDVCFLEGEEGPTVEEDEDFDTDTLRLKVRHHVAAKAIDYRGLVRSSGA